MKVHHNAKAMWQLLIWIFKCFNTNKEMLVRVRLSHTHITHKVIYLRFNVVRCQFLLDFVFVVVDV